jgi:hypothetical protein
MIYTRSDLPDHELCHYMRSDPPDHELCHYCRYPNSGERYLMRELVEGETEHWAGEGVRCCANGCYLLEGIGDVGCTVGVCVCARARVGGGVLRTARVFRHKFTLEDAIGSHTWSLEANLRVTNQPFCHSGTSGRKSSAGN